MTFPPILQTIVLGTLIWLGSVLGQDLDISSDASILFKSATVNGRAPQCQLLRREPRSPSSHFINILTQRQNSSDRFPVTVAALGQTTESMATMISLMVDDRSLPTARSYVNVLLTNGDGDQYWLSQNVRMTSPFLKVIVGSAAALSVNAVQLNLMLPMTGLRYSTGSKSQTSLLPVGDYVVEVQLVRAPSKGKGGGRNGIWQKLPSLGAGTALDQATLRAGDNVVGCARLDNLFTVSPIDVVHRVTDSIPLIQSAQDYVWFNGRQGSYQEPFFAPKPIFVVATGASSFYAATLDDGHPVQHKNATLTVLARYTDGSGSCALPMQNSTTLPVLLLSPKLAMFTLPTMDPGCGNVQFHLEFLFPDRRHRVSTDVFATTPAVVDGALDLAMTMNVASNETDKLITGLTTILHETLSTVLPRHLDSNEVYTVPDTVLAIANTSTMVAFRSLWNGRVEGWNLTQALASALVDVRTTLAQVPPFASFLATNSSSYIYTDTYVETDDFFDATDDYFSQNISSRRLSGQSSSASTMHAASVEVQSESCSMGAFLDIIDALTTMFAKLQRAIAMVRSSVVQIQVSRQRSPVVTVSALIDQLVSDGVLPTVASESLVRLYVQVVVLEVLAKNVELMTTHLATMRASRCLVPCLHGTFFTADAATCDTFFDVPLTRDAEPFSIHEAGCAAEWDWLAIPRLNAYVNGSSIISFADVNDLLLSKVTDWAATVQNLRILRWKEGRVALPVNGDFITRVAAFAPFVDNLQACSTFPKNGGRSVAFMCRCEAFTNSGEPEQQELSLQVDYLVSRQGGLGYSQVRLPMSNAPAIVRPPWLYVLNDTSVSSPFMGMYYRSPVAGYEDAYMHEDHEYRLLLRRGREACPKGEWGVVPAASSWKKYADPTLPWNNATDTVLARFSDCFFHSNAEKQAFSVSQSYNLSALTMAPGYRMSLTDH